MPVTDPASPLALPINDLFLIVLVLGALVLVGVSGALAFFALRYRGRPGAPDPEPTFGSRRLEIAWVVVPLGLVLVLFGLSLSVARAVEPPAEGRQPDLIIRGHQWWWEAVYPASGVVTANEIHIPAGRPLLVQLESADVIHNFWVPELGRKKDAIPGVQNTLWLEAARPGVYEGACAEYCGMQHAWMRLKVVAMPADEFEAWLATASLPIAAPSSDLARQGERLFAERTCAACHAIEGRAQTPNVGPNLAHLARRATIGAGVSANGTDELTAWLSDPDAIKPQSLMPDLNLTPDEVRALVAYLLEDQP